MSLKMEFLRTVGLVSKSGTKSRNSSFRSNLKHRFSSLIDYYYFLIIIETILILKYTADVQNCLLNTKQSELILWIFKHEFTNPFL